MPEPAYESCETRAVSRDSEGCVKLPGYTFHQGVQIVDSDSWRIDDGTQWGRLAHAAAAQQAASRDMLLMAARCSALDTCAGFQNTGASTDLLYQLPTSNEWVSVAHTADSRCYGIYEKTPPPTSCPRVSGYLFITQRTLDTAAASGFTAVAGGGPCSTCANSSALAAQCDSDTGCTGFSNYHGLLARANVNNASAGVSPDALLSDAPMTQFTTTPCAGMFVRAASVFPTEVEQLDRLLCGERIYCTSTQLRYHATSATSVSGNYYVDITVDIITDLTVPRGLADASGGGLRPLPSVRSLTFRCRDGSALLGGLPAGLAALTPFLQELRISGCRAAGPLPPALAQLRYLRLLDISRNALSGSLPKQWSNMTLGYLNLSGNSFTGPLPTGWRGILKPRAAAAMPPPPPVAVAPLPPPLAAPPPPPPLVVVAGRRRRVAQATAAVALQSDMLVADFSGNKLEGPVDRAYVYDSCVRRELRMQLRGEPSAELVGGFGLPAFLLQYNPGIAAWAGRYAVADLESGSGSSNLCGAFGYKVALGVLWGVFGGCLLAMAAWSAWLAWKAARAARCGRLFIADVGGPSPAEDAAAAAAAVADSPGAACRAGCASFVSRATDAAAALWRRRWVRRVTLLLRIGYLVADVALDIRVTLWLFVDGDSASAAVCLAFLVAAQAAVSAALLGSLAHHFFASNLQVAVLSPLLLALGPVAGPVLAVANIRNSDVPLVFWRYLELVEFCVALLQAPAESVTQSVAYARHNRLGNGMYMDHALFLASIILSLGDMTIAALKLFRYKRGPFRRLVVAVTHLDRERDPVDYRKPLLSPSLDGSPPNDNGEGDGGYALHFLDTPLNPPAGTGRRSPGASRSQVQTREGAGPLPVSPPGGGAAAGEAGGEAAASPVLELSPREQRDVVAEELPEVAVTTAHTFTPLTAPRYRPSLLAASSQRLGGGSAHAMGAPSRLGPGGSPSRRSSGLSLSAHPPLRPSMANLPVTPKFAQAAGAFGSSGESDASSSAQARAWNAAEAEACQSAEASGSSSGAAAGDGSLGRRSRSLQAALPAEPLAAARPLAGSISSEVYGSAATGGHGPPAAQEMVRSALSGFARAGPFHREASEPPRPSGAAAASELPPPSPPADPRLFSAAAALQAALGGSAVGGTSAVSRGPGGGVLATAGPPAPPERLVLGPAAAAGAAGSGPVSASGQSAAAGSGGVSPMASVRALRHVSSAMASSSARSVQGSPARRREVPALSIAVPISPVQSQGIEVIRVLTPDSSRNLSPQTSRGAPTPVGMLPPPPPQHLQQERLGRQQQQQQQQQRQQQQQEQGQQQQRGQGQREQQGQQEPGEPGAPPAEAD